MPAGLRHVANAHRADVWLSSVDGWYHWSVKNQIRNEYIGVGKERTERDACNAALEAMGYSL